MSSTSKTLLALSVALGLLAVQSASAVSYYWNTANGTFSTGANWSDNATSGGTTGTAPTGANSLAVFNQSSVNGNETITLSGNTGANIAYLFNNTGTTTFATNGTNKAIGSVSSSGGGLVVAASAGVVTFGNTTAGGQITIAVGSGAPITNNSSNTLSFNTANTITLGGGTAFGGTGDISVAGVIAGAPGALSKGLTTDTTVGTLTLSGLNTYGGLTSVNVGTLVAANNSLSGQNGVFGNATSEIVFGVSNGNANASILIDGAYNVGRIIRLKTNNTTDAGTRVLTLGGNTAANSEFSGDIILGTLSQAGKGVTLTAASGGRVTFSGVIQDPTGMDATTYTVTKDGLGTVVLGNNTYTGSTTVSAGTLLVNGGQTGGGAFSVGASGTLGGSGSITTASNASVTFANGASLSPGDTSASNLTFSLGSGTLNLAAMATASKLLFTLESVGASDKITLSAGTLNIGTLNSSEFAFTRGAGFTNNTTYTLFDTSAAIAYVSLDTASFSLGGGYTGTLQFSLDGQDLQLLVVPEPSTWALLAFSLTTVMVLRRRRNS